MRLMILASRAAAAAAAVFFSMGSAAAAGPIATVTHLSGVLTVRQADGSARIVAVRSAIQEGDVLSTEAQAYARLKFTDQSEVVLRPNTVLKVKAFAFEENRPEADKASLDLVKGGLRAVSGLIGKRNRDAVKFATPTATIGIRGTHFGAMFCNGDCADVIAPSGTVLEDGLHVDVADGTIYVTYGENEETVEVHKGLFGFLARLFDGVPRMIIRPSGFQLRLPEKILRDVPESGRPSAAGDIECIVQ